MKLSTSSLVIVIAVFVDVPVFWVFVVFPALLYKVKNFIIGNVD